MLPRFSTSYFAWNSQQLQISTVHSCRIQNCTLCNGKNLLTGPQISVIFSNFKITQKKWRYKNIRWDQIVHKLKLFIVHMIKFYRNGYWGILSIKYSKQSRGVLNFSRSLRRLQVVILAYSHSSPNWTTEVQIWGELCSFKCQMWCLGVKSREYTLWCTHTLYSCFLPQICEKLREQNEKTISTITATRDVIQAMHKNEYSLITSTQFRNKFT